MLCLPLQQRITVRNGSTGSPPPALVQPESGWLDLSGFQDVVAYLRVEQFLIGGATSATMTYQTAPSKDDSLFVAVTGAITLATGLTTTVMLASSTSVPLSRFLRWSFALTGTNTSTWDATFMIWIAANMVGRGARISMDTVQRIPQPTPSTPLAPRRRASGNGGAAKPPSTVGAQ